jgi:hypothetical protein
VESIATIISRMKGTEIHRVNEPDSRSEPSADLEQRDENGGEMRERHPQLGETANALVRLDENQDPPPAITLKNRIDLGPSVGGGFSHDKIFFICFSFRLHSVLTPLFLAAFVVAGDNRTGRDLFHGIYRVHEE